MVREIFTYIKKNQERKEFNRFIERIEQQEVKIFNLKDINTKNKGFDRKMIITDDSKIAEIYTKDGFCVLVFFHNGNKEEDFSSIQYGIEGFEEIDLSYLNYVYQRYHGLPLTILRTKRCILREIKIEDVDALYKIYQNKDVAKFMDGMLEDRNEEIEYTRNYINKVYGYYDFGMWIVEDIETGEVIGRAGIEQKEREEAVELGYLISESKQRQGYAYEVCSGIINYVERELSFDKIYIYTKKENIPSIKLAEKLGFRYCNRKSYIMGYEEKNKTIDFSFKNSYNMYCYEMNHNSITDHEFYIGGK